MAEEGNKETPPKKEEQITKKEPESVVLSGVADQPKLFLNAEPHIGLAVVVSSGTGLSTLMIPDITGVSTGSPVYLTKPVGIVGKNLKEFLEAKKVDLPKPAASLLTDTTISCQAFYYSKDIVLMMFTLTFKTGLISSLISPDAKKEEDKDTSFEKLFDIKGVAVRVIKCPEKSFNVLERYVAGLSAESA